jgi:hypothetical protein
MSKVTVRTANLNSEFAVSYTDHIAVGQLATEAPQTIDEKHRGFRNVFYFHTLGIVLDQKLRVSDGGIIDREVGPVATTDQRALTRHQCSGNTDVRTA